MVRNSDSEVAGSNIPSGARFSRGLNIPPHCANTGINTQEAVIECYGFKLKPVIKFETIG